MSTTTPSDQPLGPTDAAAPEAEEHANPDDLRLQRQVLRAMENAAIHGLCREGQEDIAADLVKTQRPDWEEGTILAFVRHVMAKRL